MAKTSKPFDAATKHLLAAHPESWLALIGQPSATPARLIEADLSTVTTEADRVLLIESGAPWISHFELQASRDLGLAKRLLRYNVLLDARHNLPTHSVVVLLRPKADGPELTGVFERAPHHGGTTIRFVYQVVRVWELPVDSILSGGLGTLPLAPLAGGVDSDTLPDVLRSVGERLNTDATPAEAAELWTATSVLTGLVHPKEYADDLVRRISAMILGIRGIEESSVYQAILAEGKAKGLTEGKAEGLAEGEAKGLARGEAQGRSEEAQQMLLRLGKARFGAPGADVVAAIQAMTDVGQIEAIADRLFTATGWDDLLGR